MNKKKGGSQKKICEIKIKAFDASNKNYLLGSV